MVWIRLSPSSSFVRLGICAVVAALHLIAGDEHQIGGAVVGAEADVFGNAAAEFREHHHDHVVGAADALRSFMKAADGIGGVGQQALVDVVLEHVGVEGVVAIGGVVEARGHAGFDQRGDLRQIQADDSVVDRRMIFCPGFLHQRRGVFGAAGGVEQELARGVVDFAGCRERPCRTSRLLEELSRVNLLGSSKTTGTWRRLRTASDWCASMLTRKFGGASGAMASARRPTQPYCSPLLGAAVCQ